MVCNTISNISFGPAKYAPTYAIIGYITYPLTNRFQ